MALDVAFILSATGRRGEDDCDVVLGAHNQHLQSVLCCRMRQLNPSKNHLNLLHTLHAISSMFFQRNTFTTDLRVSKYKHKVIYLAVDSNLCPVSQGMKETGERGI